MKVIFFEDLPYANRITEKQILAHIKKLEKRLKINFVNYTAQQQNSFINKEQNIRLYKTQLTDEICAEIISQLNILSGERWWGEPELINELSSFLNV